MLERPSLHALALLVATVERGSLTAAAEAEGIGQPAITAQIKALEGFYGTSLLERHARGVRPTPAGALVVDYARRALALVDELKRAVDDLEGLAAGRLVIGASSTVGEQFLPTALGRFHAAHPGIEIELEIGNSDAMLQRVLDRRIDLAYIGREPHHADHLVVEPVFADVVVAVVAPGDPLLGGAAIEPGALSDRQLVLRERGSATRDKALECLHEVGVKPERLIELGSNEAVKRAVEAGLGVGLLSIHTVRDECASGRLVELPIQGWACRRSFWQIHRADRTLTRAEQAFLALARAQGDSGT